MTHALRGLIISKDSNLSLSGLRWLSTKFISIVQSSESSTEVLVRLLLLKSFLATFYKLLQFFREMTFWKT